MNMTDPVADMITRIRNGVRAKLPKVDVPSSKLKMEIARILKDEGYIANFRLTEDNKQGVLRVFLKYGPGMERVITDLQRVSRPGCRIYCGKDEIPRVYGGLGINILSTSRGLMTGRSAAREGVGGRCFIGHIERERPRRAAFGLDRGDGGIELVLGAPVQPHLRANTRECTRARKTEPGAGACDQRVLMGEYCHLAFLAQPGEARNIEHKHFAPPLAGELSAREAR